MDWQVFAWERFANAAAGGLIVLAAGSLAVLICRQPAGRARLATLALLGGLAVPLLGARPIVPAWTARLLPAASAPGPGPEAAAVAPNDPLPPAAEGPPQPATPIGPGGVDPPKLPAATLAAPASARGPARQGPGPSRAIPLARGILLGGYCAGAAGFAAWWLAGLVALRRVARSARPAPEAAREALLGLAGPAGARVRLLESDRISLPFTYTWARPVILLPSAFCRKGADPEALRYALAHEWSHVERRDAWAWNLACLASIALFHQPLFWWLRRQLRLSQDHLADASAAAAGTAEDYAALLVRLARAGGAPAAIPALGIGDRRTNLSRRVIMLLQGQEPPERRCRAAWSLATAAAAAALVVLASGVRLDAAAPPLAADAPRGDREALLGTWEASAPAEPVAGAAEPPALERWKWAFGPDKISMSDPDGFFSHEAGYAIDPSKSPKEIDLTFRKTGVTWKGIYHLEGGALTISYSIKRPADFREGPGILVHRFALASRTPAVFLPKYELAPGCLWAIKPGGFGYRSMTSNGIHVILDEGRDGAFIVTVAYARKEGPDPGPLYHPVAFDADRKRYLPTAEDGGSSTGPTLPGYSISQIKYRLDPAVLPKEKVAHLGIEAVPADVQRAREAEASARALATAVEKGIDLLPPPRVGDPYDFRLKGSDGRVIDSRDLKGKLVLIDCWATWCAPCMEKMPALKELYRMHRADGFEIVGVNFDRDPKPARQQIEALALPWAQVFVPTDEEARNLWDAASGIDGLPRLLLIDREGILRAEPAPGEIEREVARWLDPIGRTR